MGGPIDVFLLQEHHLCEYRWAAYGSILQGSSKSYWSPGIGNCCSNAGVCISINSRWKEEVMNYVEVIPGRSQYIVIKIKDLTFGVLNIYAPNQVAERIEFWSSLTNRLSALHSWCGRNTTIC